MAKKNSYEKILKDMKKQLSDCLKKINDNVEKNAPISTLKKNATEMMLLLGEVNYLTKELKRIEKKK